MALTRADLGLVLRAVRMLHQMSPEKIIDACMGGAESEPERRAKVAEADALKCAKDAAHWEKRFNEVWCSLIDQAFMAKEREEELNLLRDELEGVRTELTKTQMESAGALDLVYRIRFALGDNGKRMQDELIAYCKHLAHNQSVLNSLGNDLKTQK